MRIGNGCRRCNVGNLGCPIFACVCQMGSFNHSITKSPNPPPATLGPPFTNFPITYLVGAPICLLLADVGFSITQLPDCPVTYLLLTFLLKNLEGSADLPSSGSLSCTNCYTATWRTSQLDVH
jgi:hypothetical protein